MVIIRTKPLPSSSLLIIAVIIAYYQIPMIIILAESADKSYYCDILSDTSCQYTNDEVCDALLGDDPKAGCEQGDCFDCNFLTCGLLDFDCEGCLNAPGCFWCPSNGRCYNSNLYELDATDSCGRDSSSSSKSTSSSLGKVDYQRGDRGGLCESPSPIFSDPLYAANAWAYDMIKVTKVWEQGIFGKGVRVRINDDGVIDHSEFKGRYDKKNSCKARQPTSDPPSRHGTAVASIIGAGGNNGKCGVGIAPEATISSCTIDDFNDDNEFLVTNVDSHDISQNSWGYDACKATQLRKRRLQEGGGVCPFQFSDPLDGSPCDVCDFLNTVLTYDCEDAIVKHCQSYYEKDVDACLEYLELLISGECSYNKVPKQALDNLANGVRKGRNGKGIIYVFASGNTYDIGDDANMDGIAFSRLSIAVGAVGKDRKHASYSTPGTPIFVSAPGGDFESSSSFVVADVYKGFCTDSGPGTSFSAPVVSGVIALMLEVNEYLTWRDVQGIIAETSQVVADDPYDNTLVVNGAGLQHSNFYGFGIIDAEASVNAARDWKLYGIEKMIVGDSGVINEPLKDTTAPINFTISISPNDFGGISFSMESTVLSLDLKHFSRGDLEVTLTSPWGTKSIMHPGKRLENSILGDDERWNLMTVRNWGESPIGDWTLTLRDLRQGYQARCGDAPFLAISRLGEVSCNLVESLELCAAGMVLDDTVKGIRDNGMSMDEACCACGGGLDTSDFQDTLRQWRLFIYGRDPDEIGVTISSSKGNMVYAVLHSVALAFSLGFAFLFW